MEQDPGALAYDLVTTCARVIRWIPTDGVPLSIAAIRLLARLEEAGPARVSDLADLERSSQPTITNHINRLEAQGLVRRAQHPLDRRAWTIDITPRGREQLAQTRAITARNIEPALARLSSTERTTLLDGLAVMRRLIDG